MKKLLLLACTAVAAMSIHAQTLAKFDNNEKSLVINKFTVHKSENIKSGLTSISDAKDYSNIKMILAKAPAMDALFGDYTENLSREAISSSPASLEAYQGTDPDTQETKTYVKIILFNGLADMIGEYDATTGKIVCGAQYISYVDANYGKIAVWGMIQKEDGMYWSQDLSFTVDELGSISLDQDAYALRIMEGDYAGYRIEETRPSVTLIPTNGKEEGYISGDNGYTKYSHNISIEDYEYTVNVYGFCGRGCASIDINDDGTVSVAAGQPIGYLDLEGDELATYGNYTMITAYNVNSEGKLIKSEGNVAGTISGNTITLNDYIRLWSKLDSDDRGYASNYYGEQTFTLNEGTFIKGGNGTGIDEIGVTREDKIKNTKTYNLMGQQVNRATAKGLLIRDGKKYIKKY